MRASLLLLTLLAAVPVRAATFTVTTTDDAVDASPGDGVCATAAGACSLRAAVQEANALAGADAITIPAGTYTLSIAGREENVAATGDLDVTDDLTITGAGADVTILDAAMLDRLIHVRAATVSVSGLTMQNGLIPQPVGEACPDFSGGAVRVEDGALALDGVLVANSETCSNGGGVAAVSTGSTQLTITNSAIVGNRAGAGAIVLIGFGGGTVSATLTNVTITGNVQNQGTLLAGSNGGAITADLTNVTMAGNTNGISTGGILGAISIRLKNTILANTTGECGPRVFSQGNNLADDATCAAVFTQPGDLNSANASLLPLAHNGGPTPTLALGCGSAALDAGTSAGAPATDQRGFPRTADGNGDGTATTDIGAFEQDVPDTRIAVTTTADAGPGSLRAAIDTANSRPDGSSICFGIPGAGPHRILPATDFAQLTRAMTIDGYTQLGASPNTLAVGSNAVLKVEVDGQGARGTGFIAAVDNITIRGLAIGGFSFSGISVENGSSPVSGARIEGNFIGTDPFGTVARPNGQFGVALGTGGGHIVGGLDPAARNVISGNGTVGVQVSATGSSSATSASNQILGNLIGTQPDGVSRLSNLQNGVAMQCGGRDNLVQGNTVAFNGTSTAAHSGVRVFSDASTCAVSFGNRILGNAVFGNAGPGIDLTGVPVPDPGDPGDADGGANQGQNAPVLVDLVLDGPGSLRATYRVDSDPANSTFPLRVEFFRALDGEGAAFLGADDYTQADYDGCGTPPCDKTVVFGAAVVNGDAVVATATDDAGNTGEFSVVPRVVGFVLTLTGAEGWRMLAPAYTNQTYDDLLGPLWTQGFTGADGPAGTPNAFIYDEAVTTDTNADGTADLEDGFAPLGEQTGAAPSGRGFFAYVYADDDAGTPGTQGGFPKTILQDGAAYVGPFPAPFPASFNDSGNLDDDGWLLLGNPFDAGMDWDAVGWTRTNVSSALHVWDPNDAGGPQYLTWSAGIGGSLPDGVVAPNQGFWAKAMGAAPVLEAPAAARVAGGTFQGRTAGRDSTTVVSLRLAGTLGGTVRATTAFVAFLDGAATGIDAHDAYELTPLASPSLLLYATSGDGPALDIDARPVPTEPTEVALGVEALVEGPAVPHTLTLSWPELRALPAHWTARLEDRQTGATVDLRTTPSYTFEATPAPALASGPGVPTRAAPRRRNGAARLVLVLGPTAPTASGPAVAPTELALLPPRPNPATDVVTVGLDLPEAARVDLLVYDLLGREVAVLVRDQRPAGRHDVALDTGALAPGVYVLRLTTDGAALTRRLVVAR